MRRGTLPDAPAKIGGVGAWDDDDWVGEPPEGRHSRERARPDFWRNHWQEAAAGAVLAIAALVAVVIALA